MIEALVSVLAAGIVGSLHCTSMCGGLVAFATAGPAPARLPAIAAYQSARGAGYVVLGALSGTVGAAIDDTGVRVGVGRMAGFVAGALMIAWGVVKLVEASGLRPRSRDTSAFVPLSRFVRRAREASPLVRSAVVGGCTAALPCGFLHAFLLAAAGTGSAARGAAMLAAFWIGTLPALTGLGLGVGLLAGRLKRHAALVGALVLVTLGLTSLLGRWSPASFLSDRLDPSTSAVAPCHAH